MTIPTVSLNNDFEFRYAVRRDNSTTGASEAAAGLTITGWFSSSDGGADIGGTSTSMPELSGKAGTYLGTLAAATLTTALSASAGARVFEVITQSGHLLYSQPVLVLPVARPS